MGIETAAHRIEEEARTNPNEAAAGMRLLSEAQQSRLIEQMQKDARQQDANFAVQRDKSGNVTSITFTPLFQESTTSGQADRPARH